VTLHPLVADHLGDPPRECRANRRPEAQQRAGKRPLLVRLRHGHPGLRHGRSARAGGRRVGIPGLGVSHVGRVDRGFDRRCDGHTPGSLHHLDSLRTHHTGTLAAYQSPKGNPPNTAKLDSIHRPAKQVASVSHFLQAPSFCHTWVRIPETLVNETRRIRPEKASRNMAQSSRYPSRFMLAGDIASPEGRLHQNEREGSICPLLCLAAARGKREHFSAIRKLTSAPGAAPSSGARPHPAALSRGATRRIFSPPAIRNQLRKAAPTQLPSGGRASLYAGLELSTN
jgi:hypothetical protein